ncbi:MAG: ferritin-like domain-containing protein [Acidimicrobiales bacterium]
MDARTNLDRHLRGSRRLDLTGVEWDAIPLHPLTAAEARCLAYMMDIETHTVIFLRDLLATRVADEPEITAFLACWVYEELWHGEALSRFLGEAGIPLAPDRELPGHDDPYPSRVARNAGIRLAGRLRGRLTRAGLVATSLLSKTFPATHMTWGALNELSTLTGYQRMVDTTAHPVLADLLSRIIRDERRHYSYYRLEAERRLGESSSARRVTRLALDRVWAMVGSGVRPQEETDFVMVHLFGDSDGLETAHRLDAMVDTLPGLDGLRLFETARQEAVDRVAA